MARYELYTSIDIGSRNTKGAVVLREEGRYSILGYVEVESRGIENGDIKDIGSFKDNMNRVIDELSKQFPKINHSTFVFSFSSDKFVLDEHAEEDQLVPEEEEQQVTITGEMLEELKERATYRLSGPEEGYLVFHFYPKRYLINGSRVVFNPTDMKAKSLTMEFIAVKVDFSLAESLRTTLEDVVGFEPFLFASPITSAEGVLTPTEKDSGVVMIEIGHDFTTIVAYLNGIPIRFSVVPVGVKHVIKDIAYVLGTSIDEAEMLLKSHGSALYETQQEEGVEVEYRALDGRTLKRISTERLSLIINARVREILNKARRIFKDLERRVPEYRENGIPGGVVLTGGGAKIKGISEIAGQVFRTNVRLGTFLRSIPGDYPVIEGEEEIADDPAFSAVFGNVVTYVKLAYEETGAAMRRKKGFLETILRFLKSLF